MDQALLLDQATTLLNLAPLGTCKLCRVFLVFPVVSMVQSNGLTFLMFNLVCITWFPISDPFLHPDRKVGHAVPAIIKHVSAKCSHKATPNSNVCGRNRQNSTPIIPTKWTALLFISISACNICARIVPVY